MSTPNPYESGAADASQPYQPDMADRPAKRPGALTAVCIISIVLGSLGLFGALFGTVGLLFQDKIQEFSESLSNPQGMGGEMEQLTQEMQHAVKNIQDRWRVWTIVFLIGLVVLAGCLLMGGIKTLQLSASGRSLLNWTMVALIVFELARFMQHIGIQMDTMDVMQEYMGRIMTAASRQQGGGAPPGAQKAMSGVMETSMKVGMIFGLVMGGGWVLLKLVFYILGAVYLRKPHIRALVSNNGGPATVDPV